VRNFIFFAICRSLLSVFAVFGLLQLPWAYSVVVIDLRKIFIVKKKLIYLKHRDLNCLYYYNYSCIKNYTLSLPKNTQLFVSLSAVQSIISAVAANLTPKEESLETLPENRERRC